jgi:hypothetical protein
LATSGDFLLATSGDFLMAMDNLVQMLTKHVLKPAYDYSDEFE